MPAERRIAMDLIDEACVAGARQVRACAVLEIDVRTLRRWQQQQREERRLIDRRRERAGEREPVNKLSPEERTRILEVCNAGSRGQVFPFASIDTVTTSTLLASRRATSAA